MRVRIYPSFIADLIELDEPHFARRVLSKVLTRGGDFLRGSDDHRYHGIHNAWIRYVSRGATAYRVIYIQDGEDVFLYRAGRHRVEDNLELPPNTSTCINLRDAHHDLPAAEPSIEARYNSPADLGQLLYTSTPIKLKHFIVSLGQISHREIWLVAPFVSPVMLRPTHAFGRLLFKAREDGAAIGLITRPPSDQSELKDYERLELEDITVAFVERLHAKLYLFDVADEEKYRSRVPRSSSAIVGSANLTDAAFALDDRVGNEELCYRIPTSKFEEARKYVAWLEQRSKDTKAYRRILM